MKTVVRRDVWMKVAGLVAIAFGVLTVKEGGAVLYGAAAARESAGHYVPFVLWFNFLAGFAYVVAGLGLWWRQRWAVGLAIAIAAATLVVFAAFGVHVASGGAWEPRTAIAMSARSVVWMAIAAVAAWRLRRASS